MNSEVSRYIEKFNAIYYPIKDKIGNIGVIVAGFALAVLSLFVRTDIFGFLLDFFGVIGILAGIVVVVIGVFMLGVEEGWWKAPAAFNKQPANPAPQVQPTTPQQQPAAPQRAEAQSDAQPAVPPEPAQQPEYLESQETGSYDTPAQEQYAPASYQLQPQSQQGGFRMPDFIIRMRGKILISALVMFVGAIVLSIAFTPIRLIFAFIPFTSELLDQGVRVLGSIAPNLVAGGIGGIIAGSNRKAILAALLCSLLTVILPLGFVTLFTLVMSLVGVGDKDYRDLANFAFKDLEFWIYFLIGGGALLIGAVIGNKIMAEHFGIEPNED